MTGNGGGRGEKGGNKKRGDGSEGKLNVNSLFDISGISECVKRRAEAWLLFRRNDGAEERN